MLLIGVGYVYALYGIYATDIIVTTWHKYNVPEDYRELFGNKVKELRKQLGLTQEQVAGAMGMDLTSINEIENGHRNPTLHTLVKLAQVLKVKPAELISSI